jgi:hypothetical protein
MRRTEGTNAQHMPVNLKDLVAKSKTESKRASRGFRETIDKTIRCGPGSRRATAQQQAFKIMARDLGNLKPGLSLDYVAELLVARI